MIIIPILYPQAYLAHYRDGKKIKYFWKGKRDFYVGLAVT